MNLIETALHIALDAHCGQRDKAGEAYILHPLRLMHNMRSAHEKATALLHDVLEDSPHSRESLLEAGIPIPIVEAVQALTRNRGESYPDFIQRAKANPLARKVKIADIEDNINILRLTSLSSTDLERLKKYHTAWQVLIAD